MRSQILLREEEKSIERFLLLSTARINSALGFRRKISTIIFSGKKEGRCEGLEF
jgi:hypothetical protein